MPINWFAILKTVPWGEVIDNAPKIVEGARKLLKSAAKQPGARGGVFGAASESRKPPGEQSSITALEAKVTDLESAVSDLQREILTSSGLIKALADQNAQLVKRAEAAELRSIWLAVVSAVAIIASAASLYLGLR